MRYVYSNHFRWRRSRGVNLRADLVMGDFCANKEVKSYVQIRWSKFLAFCRFPFRSLIIHGYKHSFLFYAERRVGKKKIKIVIMLHYKPTFRCVLFRSIDAKLMK